MDQAILAHLQETHERYCHYNQTPGQNSEWMADHGHPMASQYRRLRSFFDRLRFACNSGARYFTYQDENNYSEYWAPSLELTREPRGEAFSSFYHAYPAMGEHWDNYLKAAAEAGWPATVDPRLDSGTWLVSTTDEAMAHALSSVVGVNGEPLDKDVWSFRVYDPGFQKVRTIRRVIWLHQKDAVLPYRQPEDENADRQALPLPQKHFALGYVERVTVTDYHVLVPLIPVGEAGMVKLEENVNALVDLLGQGFPWSQCEPYLKKHLKRGAFNRLARQHGLVDGQQASE